MQNDFTELIFILDSIFILSRWETKLPKLHRKLLKDP